VEELAVNEELQLLKVLCEKVGKTDYVVVQDIVDWLVEEIVPLGQKTPRWLNSRHVLKLLKNFGFVKTGRQGGTGKATVYIPIERLRKVAETYLPPEIYGSYTHKFTSLTEVAQKCEASEDVKISFNNEEIHLVWLGKKLKELTRPTLELFFSQEQIDHWIKKGLLHEVRPDQFKVDEKWLR
jgi:hypothetical protein